jgi:hypothetical protein
MEADMSYQEQRSVVTMVSGAAIFIAFLVLAGRRYAELDPAVVADGVQVLRWGAGAMLLFIASSIVIRIVVLILFTILYRGIAGEAPPSIEDERDKQIELKVNQMGQTVFILGFVAALVAIRVGSGPVGMLLWIAGSGVVSEVISETTRIVFYRRGF